MTRNTNNRLRASLVIAALMASPPAPLHAADHDRSDPGDTRLATPTAEAMIVDGFLVRPIGLASTVIGAGLFIITLPFSAGGENVDQARERFIDEPVWFTFRRCLGCFDGAYRRLPPEVDVQEGERR